MNTGWSRSALAALVVCATAGTVSAQAPARGKNVRVSFEQRFGRAVYRECRLSAVAYEGSGRVSLWCARSVSSPKPLPDDVAERALTPAEVGKLVTLFEESRLYSGTDVAGTDTTPGDGVLEILIASTAPAGTVALVTSGNQSFASGSRGALVALLRTFGDELRKSIKR